MSHTTCTVIFFVVGLVVAVENRAAAQTGENVLVVVNHRSAASEEIGDYYTKVRAIPPAQVVRIDLPEDDVVARSVYQAQIELPIAEWLARNAAHDRILYIVLTKGVPLRIDGTRGREGTGASVDSELTLLYRRLTGVTVAPQGPVPNPYYRGQSPVNAALRFTHREFDIYLVTRLDGYTVRDVIGLIDRGATPSSNGAIVLDQKADLSNAPGETWLKAAADVLREGGFGDRTVLESTTRRYTGTEPVLGYYSWGSNDVALRTRNPGLTFSPGALAATYLSSDARTFHEPPAEWIPGDPSHRLSYFAGLWQSLTGDLVRSGVTGVAGHVAEPYTDAAVRPEVVFPAYLAGFNLAESFYLAVPFLSWQSVVVGDPLCAAAARDRASTDDVRGNLDSTTELPVFFSARRLNNLASAGYDRDAVTAFLRGQARAAREDEAGARAAYEAATAREPRMNNAHALLAAMYERAGEYDSAIERYQAILATAPNDPLALNNLAYAMAVRRHAPQDALPMARKAFTLLRVAETADTLGWVLHLTGDEAAAAQLFAEIVRTPTGNPDILVHAAFVFAAVGQPEAAGQQLKRAAALDSTVEQRDDVKQLREQISRGKEGSGGEQTYR